MPPDWAGKPAALFVEQTKKLTVFLDGGPALGGGRQLSSPHLVPLGPLTPGRHTLTLCVDNHKSVWPDRVTASHMLEDATQTNWNGVLGRIELRTTNEFGIQGVQSGAAGGDPRRLGVRVYLDPSVTARQASGLKVQGTLFQNGKPIGVGRADGDFLIISAAKSAALWDEFHPNLCRLTVEATAPGFSARWQGMVGLRDFRGAAGHLLINGGGCFCGASMTPAFSP